MTFCKHKPVYHYRIAFEEELALWSGFRKKQGCVLQIVALFLSMELASDEDSTFFICLLDYEKAFDFTNRSVMAINMMNYGIGDKFLLNFFNSNINTY